MAGTQSTSPDWHQYQQCHQHGYYRNLIYLVPVCKEVFSHQEIPTFLNQLEITHLKYIDYECIQKMDLRIL